MVAVTSWPGGRGGGSKVRVSFTPATSLSDAASAVGCPDSARSSSPARSSALSGSRPAPPSCTTTTAGVSGWPAVTLRTVISNSLVSRPASCSTSHAVVSAVQPWTAGSRSAPPDMPGCIALVPSPTPSESAASPPPRQGTVAAVSSLFSAPESNTSATTEPPSANGAVARM